MPLNVQRPLGRDLDTTTVASLFQAAGVDSPSMKMGRLWNVILIAPLAIRPSEGYECGQAWMIVSSWWDNVEVWEEGVWNLSGRESDWAVFGYWEIIAIFRSINRIFTTMNIITNRPNPNAAFPNPKIPSFCYIKNVVKNPLIVVGDYTYYGDVDGAD